MTQRKASFLVYVFHKWQPVPLLLWVLVTSLVLGPERLGSWIGCLDHGCITAGSRTGKSDWVLQDVVRGIAVLTN